MSGRRAGWHEAGMTLLEVLVTLTVSSLVLTIIAGLYITVLNLDRRARNLQDLDDASVAMEILTKDLRLTSRDPRGVVIWEQETDGIRHDIVGIFSAAPGTDRTQSTEPTASSAPPQSGWIYFLHDPLRAELWRIERSGDAAAPPSTDGGRIVARNVQSFRVTREGGLLNVTIVAVKSGQTVRLQTAIWPRNQ